MRIICPLCLVALFGCLSQNVDYVIDEEAELWNADQEIYQEFVDKVCSSPDDAAKVSERILVKVFGNGVLAERPWRITETEQYYLLTGSLDYKSYCGGVAQLKMRKSDGYVWVYYHGE